MAYFAANGWFYCAAQHGVYYDTWRNSANACYSGESASGLGWKTSIGDDSYISRLLENEAVTRWIVKRHSDLIEQLQAMARNELIDYDPT